MIPRRKSGGGFFFCMESWSKILYIIILSKENLEKRDNGSL